MGQPRCSKISQERPTIGKKIFLIQTPNGPSTSFIKHAYELLTPSDSQAVLIHYIGDEKKASYFPYGNASSENARLYIRTGPSFLKSLETTCQNATPAKAYTSHITQVPASMHLPVLQP